MSTVEPSAAGDSKPATRRPPRSAGSSCTRRLAAGASDTRSWTSSNGTHENFATSASGSRPATTSLRRSGCFGRRGTLRLPRSATARIRAIRWRRRSRNEHDQRGPSAAAVGFRRPRSHRASIPRSARARAGRPRQSGGAHATRPRRGAPQRVRPVRRPARRGRAARRRVRASASRSMLERGRMLRSSGDPAAAYPVLRDRVRAGRRRG